MEIEALNQTILSTLSMNEAFNQFIPIVEVRVLLPDETLLSVLSALLALLVDEVLN